jgi:hypothetical protein
MKYLDMGIYCLFTMNFHILEDASIDIFLPPGPKILPGRIQQVRRPFVPLAFITIFSPSALVSV